MRRFDQPAQPVDPYPSAETEIAGFRYDSALVLVRAKDAVKLRTGEDADYIVGRDYLCSWRPPEGDWRQLRVPAGLVTDLASVPAPFRGVVGRVGPWLEAAIVHDYLYIAWQDVPGRGPQPADKRFADRIMLAAMREAQVSAWRMCTIYGAVTLFGGATFERPNADRYVDLDDLDLSGQMAETVPR